jgi:hypothetical protein
MRLLHYSLFLPFLVIACGLLLQRVSAYPQRRLTQRRSHPLRQYTTIHSTSNTSFNGSHEKANMTRTLNGLLQQLHEEIEMEDTATTTIRLVVGREGLMMLINDIMKKKLVADAVTTSFLEEMSNANVRLKSHPVKNDRHSANNGTAFAVDNL